MRKKYTGLDFKDRLARLMQVPKHLLTMWRTLPPPALIIGFGVTLASFLTVFRIAILRDDLALAGASSAFGLVVRASSQDWLVVLLVVFAGLMTWRRGRGWPGLVVAVLCNLLLFWGVANVVAVSMLGEPVTLNWLLYSDILNSSFVLESVLHFVTLTSVMTMTAVGLAFNGIAILGTRLLARAVDTKTRTFITALSE